MPEEKNLLIKENKQVADLNRVPGFDPAKLLQKSVKGQEGASDQVPQLMLKYKKLWFRLACPNGRIRLVARHLTEKIAVVEAEIYRDKADPVPVSNFVASRTAHDTPGGLYIQAAQYEAVDNALTDAGFGIQLCDVCKTWGEEAYTKPVSKTMDEMQGYAVQSSEPVIERHQEEQKDEASTPEMEPVPNQVLPECTSATQKVVPAENENSAAHGSDLEKPSMQPGTNEDSAQPAAPEAAPVGVIPDNSDSLTTQGEEASDISLAEQSMPAETVHEAHPVTDTEAEHREMEPNAIVGEADVPGDESAEAQHGAQDGELNDTEKTSAGEADQVPREMTLEEAMNVIADVGSCRGKTLAQIADRRPTTLRWYFTTCPDSSEHLRKAARMVFESLNLQKSA